MYHRAYHGATETRRTSLLSVFSVPPWFIV
jgi:hypothetical protein